MPKKFLKRMVPDTKKIQNNKHLKIFARFLENPNLWHLHRYSVATAVSIALFSSFIPLPIHTPLALVLCILFHANIPICLLLIWLNTPLTYFPIFYFAFRVGSFLLGRVPAGFDFEMTYAWWVHELEDIWEPFLLGSLVCAVVFAILGNMLIRIIWRCSVSRSWKKRKAKRLQKK